jgi:cell division protein FtsB
MGNGKDTSAVNLEQLIAQQSELQKTIGAKRKELHEVEKKNREVKAQIGTMLNLPKGVSIAIRRVQA